MESKFYVNDKCYIDFDGQVLIEDFFERNLTSRQIKILKCLISRLNKVVEYETFLDAAWSYDEIITAKQHERKLVIDAISDLRGLSNILRECIKTQRDVGYKFVCSSNSQNPTPPKINNDILKGYNAFLAKKLYKPELRDVDGEIKDVISKVYVFPRFKNSTSSSATPASGHHFKNILLGDSGLGKSLFSELIALSLSVEQLTRDDIVDINEDEWNELVSFAKDCRTKLFLEKYQPVFIKATNLNNVKDFSNLKNVFLENFFGSNKFDDSLKNVLSSQKILFIVDGVDEMEHNKRRNFCGQLADFSPEENNCSLLATSRKIPLVNMRNVGKWELCEMNDTQVKEFVDKIGSRYEGFFASLDKEWVKEIVSKNEYLSVICKNPYFLIHTLLSLRGQQANQISIAKIYSSITDGLIRSRMDSRGISDDNVHVALRKVAWEMLSQRNEGWSLNSNKTEIIIEESMSNSDKEAFLGNINSFIDLLSHNSGLLAYQESGYAFLHNMFFCFYVAIELASRIEELAKNLGYIRSGRNFEFSGKHIFDISETLDCLAERLDEEETKTILTMVFAPLKGANQALCLLLEWLLYKSATAENDIEVNNIAEIFKDFIEGNFEKMELNDIMKEKLEKLLLRVIQKNSSVGDEKNE